MRLLLITLSLLWLQLFWTLTATWRFGEYYAYGWFVPVLAAGLFWRRWQWLAAPAASAPTAPAAAPRVPGWLAAAALLAVLLILPLRWIATADPGWRPPLLLQTVLTCALFHGLLWQACGRRVALGLLPVTVFALSAVPYPWQLEQHLIRTLTGGVVTLTREMFLLAGQPVELLGERLVLGTNAVDVTDGCSGIRSFQSLVMVALFFGELLLLAWPGRLGLVLVAGLCALGVNAGRAYALARIHFERGEAAATAAHDLLGHAAFALSSLILFLTARSLVLRSPPGTKVVRRIQSQPPVT